MIENEYPMVDAREILRAVGGAAFTRGKGYASADQLQDFSWAPEQRTLSALVVGSAAVPYRTQAALKDKAGAWLVDSTTCNCPEAENCKHAAALLIYCNTLHLRAKDVFFKNSAASATPAWQESLNELLRASKATAAPTSAPRSTDRLPLQDMALQFDLQDTTVAAHRQWAPGSGVGHQKAAKRRWRLGVRPMVRSGNERWVRGNLKWNTISFKTFGLNLDAEQHRWFCQFVPLYRATGQLYFGEDNDWLYLDEFSSLLLWPLMDEATKLGISLIGIRSEQQVRVLSQATVALAAEKTDAGIELIPWMQLGDIDIPLGPDSAAGSIGNHGVYASTPDQNLIVIAPVPGGLRDTELEMLRSPSSVQVPESDIPDFMTKLYPRLGRRLAVRSIDDSVQLPRILPPVLVAKVKYSAKDAVDLDWGFDYGGYSVEADARDVQAETRLERAALEILGRFPALESRVLAPRTLRGLDTVDFVRHTLPALAEVAGIRLEEKGERPEFLELTETPELTVTTVESDRRDWFDLGLIISIGERRIPFADILRALSRGQDKLLMPDKSYFSLAHPLFDKLRLLVGEAGALSDKNHDLSITRYQASFWEELDALATHTEVPTPGILRSARCFTWPMPATCGSPPA